MHKIKMIPAQKTKAICKKYMRKMLKKKELQDLADMYKFHDPCANIGSVGNGL